MLNILAVGDVVGQEAVALLEQHLWNWRKELGADLAVVNAENAAVGNGLDPDSAARLLHAGADVLTSGNHIFQKKSIYEYLDAHDHVIRPANYPPHCPGSGYTLTDVCGWRALVINVSGTVFLDTLACPFETVDRILDREAGKYDFALLDIHAEATAEKIALARYFDGRISCIWGTHTHVATADEKILPGGSGYITDLGMTGPTDSVLGVETDVVIEKFRTKMPVHFRTAQGGVVMHGALYTLEPSSGKTVSVRRVCLPAAT